MRWSDARANVSWPARIPKEPLIAARSAPGCPPIARSISSRISSARETPSAFATRSSEEGGRPPADVVSAGGLGDWRCQPVVIAKICMAEVLDPAVLLISGKVIAATVLAGLIGTVVA
jgi:hypothetical protein